MVVAGLSGGLAYFAVGCEKKAPPGLAEVSGGF